MRNPTVGCILRAGAGFDASYVTRLYENVKEYWTGALDFFAITDTPINHPGVREIPTEHTWPSHWCKLELFRPDISGDFLYFDLDTMICGSLADVQSVDRHAMLKSYRWKYRCASGVMFLPEAVRPVVWQRFIRNPGHYMRCHHWPNPYGRLPGDQGFVQETWERYGWGEGVNPSRDWAANGIRRWQKMLPGQVLSYKKHVRPKGKVPPNARVICFHGDPRPHQIGWRLPG